MKRAFTLVELLVAMVLTLILVAAIAQFYAIVGDSVKDGRAGIELGGRLRAVQVQLQSDLESCTSNAEPWSDPDSSRGYFEYHEGIACDYNANGNFAAGLPIADSAEDILDLAANQVGPNGQFDLLEYGVTNMVGDGDDFLAFTIRSLDQPLQGRVYNPLTQQTSIATSNLAEVVWWVAFDDMNGNGVWEFNEPRNLYRRQLIIRPDITGIDGTATYPTYLAAVSRLRALQQLNDVSLSARAVLSGNIVVYRIDTNSISDLSRREHRFPHDQANLTRPDNSPWLVLNFPFPATLMNQPKSAKTPGVTDQATLALLGPAAGEDVILSNILAFDVQIYDPFARIWPDNPQNPSVAVVPSDPGYAAAAQTARPIVPAPFVGLGAYVDLGYYRNLPAAIRNEANTAAVAALPHYAGPPALPPSLPPAQVANYLSQLGCTFDTWPLIYERDGMFQLSSWGVPVARMDLAANGLDDLNLTGQYENGVDDALERETNAPYPNRPRGMQVKVRVYEPSTRQVRQVTLGTDFVME